MENMTTRQLQAERTRERIVFAVSEMLRHNDIHDIKIRDICTQASISVGTFYLYFPNKEAALLYSYRNIDKVFEYLGFSGDKKQDIAMVFQTHLALVSEDNLRMVKQMYICHLTFYDEYFFNEARPFFVTLYERIAALEPELDDEVVKDLTWKLMSLSRGFIYNLCIRPGIDVADWQVRKLDELMGYLDYLLIQIKSKSHS